MWFLCLLQTYRWCGQRRRRRCVSPELRVAADAQRHDANPTILPDSRDKLGAPAWTQALTKADRLHTVKRTETELQASVQRYLTASRAQTTRATYSTGQRVWFWFLENVKNYASDISHVDKVDDYHLSQFAAWLHDVRGVTEKTIELYVTSVKAWYSEVIYGYQPPSKLELTIYTRVLHGIKRIRTFLQEDEDDCKREPITKQMLIDMYHIMNLHITDIDHGMITLMYWSAFTFAFAGFLRVSEYTLKGEQFHMLKQLKYHKSNDEIIALQYHLPSSKTDQFYEGATIMMAATNTVYCPVKAFVAYLNKRKQMNFNCSHERAIFINDKGLPIKPDHINLGLKHLVKLIGLNPDNYSSHSLRSGAATEAFRANISYERIKLLGRWKSSAVDVYIKTNTNDLLAASREHLSYVNTDSDKEHPLLLPVIQQK
jgi:hypothetical protein